MNDRARFDALVEVVLDPLQRYVGRRCAATQVGDVVADVLVVLWRRLDDVPVGAELPWTYGVARRCLANARRGERRRDALTLRLSVQPMVDATDDQVDRLVLRDRVGRAIGGLRELDAEIVRLWAWEGLEPREIATVVDLTANAVSIRLHRAKRQLSDSLADLARQDPGPAGHIGSNRGDRPRREAR